MNIQLTIIQKNKISLSDVIECHQHLVPRQTYIVSIFKLKVVLIYVRLDCESEMTILENYKKLTKMLYTTIITPFVRI